MSALTLGLIAACAWGLHDFMVRFVTQKIPIGTCIITVLVVGLCLQLGLTLGTGQLVALTLDTALLGVGAGTAFTIANFGLYAAFKHGPVWLAAPIVACFSVISVAIAIASGVTVSLLQWLAVLAILCGIFMVSAFSNEKFNATHRNQPTVLYGLISAIGFSITFELGQILTAQSNEMQSALLTRIAAILITLGILIAKRLPFWAGTKALPVLAVMGLADCIAILSVVSAAGLHNAQYAAVATSMYGLLAIILAVLFLGERLNWLQWSGCLLAFTAIGFLAL